MFKFVSPISDRPICMIELEDVGYFSRCAFDHQAAVSGKDLSQENFMAFWAMCRHDVNRCDWTWIRKTNPRGYMLESWMGAKGYHGLLEDVSVLKNMEDKKSVVPNLERI